VALEQHLVKWLGELFDLSYDLLLYDVTSTYFEGVAARNPQAKRGHSRDHRPDCKQVCIALVVTREGMPLGYEVFDGNRADVATVEEIVETMEQRYGAAQRVWVMNRGMSSASNIAWLTRTGRRYLIGASKSELRKSKSALEDSRDWQKVRDGVEAKLCAGPAGGETFLLCRSADRREKERAMQARFAKRTEDRLARLERRLARARAPEKPEAIGRQIGRILGENSRAAGRYQVEVIPDDSRQSRVRVTWSTQPEWDDWATHSEGAYILRTNLADWDSETLWRRTSS
jgi:transposase